jgi:metallo-beta-lactamase family protein
VLHKLFEENIIPDVPVFVDSPLAVSATEIFRLHPEGFNHRVYEDLFERENPFGFENLTLIRAVKASKELNELKGTAIIIAASGMCEAGRILHHLKNGIGDPKNTVLFVGYCAENTLGRKIREGEKEVPILGDRYQVRAHIEKIDSFSGHADHSELLEYFSRMTGPKERVFLVHGEQNASAALKEALDPMHDGKIEVAVLGREVIL